jgi:hypothetical protein
VHTSLLLLLLLLVASGLLSLSGIILISTAMAESDGISPSGGKNSDSSFDMIGGNEE